MSSRAADALAALFGRLAPKSPQPPGRPPKKSAKQKRQARSAIDPVDLARNYRVRYAVLDAEGKPTGHHLTPFPGALHPARCGAGQTQTRSKRLDVETDTDLAAALAAVRDPVSYQLVLLVAIPWWVRDQAALEHGLKADIDHKADRMGWRDKRWIERRYSQLIVQAALVEMVRSDACQHCGCTGRVLDLEHRPVVLVICPKCMGTRRTRTGAHKRAKAIRMRYAEFRSHPARHAYDWMLAECNQRLERAAQAVAAARGRWNGDFED